MKKILVGRGNSAVAINDFKIVEIHDLTNYAYTITKKYTIKSEEEVIVAYSTSSESRYCAVYGCFCTLDCAKFCLPKGEDVVPFRAINIFRLAAILGRVLTEHTCSVKKEKDMLIIEYR